jgi:protein-disulfide isomerase
VTRWTLPLVAALGIALGALGMTLVRPSADARLVRETLLANPEIIPEAMTRLQEREASRAVAAQGPAITRPYKGAFIGNPQADVTVVEFFDYNCGYCRASLPAIRELVASDPKVRVVFRELPILAESSRTAARASLAAAAQNRYAAFHTALYGGGRVTDASIAAAARSAGVDLSRADQAAADAEIARNAEAAGKLGLTGTPSWVIGSRVVSGALPLPELQAAIAAVRAAR